MPLVARNALIALGISLVIVGTVAYAVNHFNRLRIAELNALEDQIAIDTLSLETQLSLLERAPCTSAASASLSTELADLGSRLAHAEEQLGSDNEQVIRLKKQYSLLEIQDYLITKRLAEACSTNPVTVLYFYSNTEGTCESCDRAGFALSYLRDEYPHLRVYSFDYNLDLGALKTLIAVEKVKAEFPAFLIKGKAVYGFTSLEDLQKQFPKGALSTTTAAR